MYSYLSNLTVNSSRLLEIVIIYNMSRTTIKNLNHTLVQSNNRLWYCIINAVRCGNSNLSFETSAKYSRMMISQQGKVKSNVALFAKLIQMTLCPPLAVHQIALVLIIIRLLSEQLGNLYTHRTFRTIFVQNCLVITLHCLQFQQFKVNLSPFVYKSLIFVICCG